MDVMEPSVFSWPSAFYLSSDHKWEYGELQVAPSTLRFYNVTSTSTPVSTPEKQAKSLLQTVRFHDITEIKKASSSYVFKCIVISSKQGESYWFGSFPGRDGAYNTLLHFWKQQLIPQSPGGLPQDASPMGRELLKIAQESKDTLEETGSALKKQGEQLEYARSIMDDIHNDLEVAEHLTDNLESWFGQWGFSSQGLVNTEPLEIIDSRGVPVIHEIPILYQTGSSQHTHQTTQLQQHSPGGSQSLLSKIHLSPKRVQAIQQHNGTLRLSSEEVAIVDSHQDLICQFKPSAISSVNVISPWKLSIVKYCIGEPDMVYRITSTRLIQILPVLHAIIRDKIQYDSLFGEPVENAVWPGTVVSPASTDSECPVLGPSNITTAQVYSTSASDAQAVAVETSTTSVTESEVTQLKEMIGEMKAVALDIQLEQDKQLDTIDQLTGSVDSANDRLKSTTRRVNKLV